MTIDLVLSSPMTKLLLNTKSVDSLMNNNRYNVTVLWYLDHSSFKVQAVLVQRRYGQGNIRPWVFSVLM